MNRLLLIAGSVCAFFSLHIVVRWLPLLRYFVYTFNAGAIIAVLGYGALVFLTVRTAPEEDELSTLKTLKPLPFTHPVAWQAEARALEKLDGHTSDPLYPQSFLISDSISSVLDIIIENFVASWYKSISPDPAFIGHVNKTIRHAVENIRDRLLGLDTVELVVGRIVPLITTHLSDFSTAERTVRGKNLNKNLTESEELDLAIAGKYRDGKLHPAASLAFSDMKLAQQDHLRAMVKKLLPLILPERELKSGVMGILIREIVACAVIAPIMMLLSDPDTWNQLVEAVGKSMLQDRKNVKKLRAALDEHATPRSRRSGDSAGVRVVPFLRLFPTDDERTFERFIRSIRQCNNLSDARRMRNEISSQLKKDSKIKGQDNVYIRRLETGKRLLDQRVAYLSAGSSGAAGSRQPELGPRRSSTQSEPTKLVDILRDSSGLSYFMEHMDRQNRLSLVQFWLVVDGLRNPLEDDIDEDDEQPASTSKWTESDRNDIAQVYEAYFSKKELKISEKTKNDVRVFLKAGSKASPRQYHRARAAILSTQTAVLEEMQNRDLVSFRNSDLYYKYLASDDLASNSTASRNVSAVPQFTRSASWVETPITRDGMDPMLSSRHSFDGQGNSDNMDGWDDGLMSSSIQSLDQNYPTLSSSFDRKGTPDKGIVEAMEAVLNDIVEEKPGMDESKPFRQPSPGPLFMDSPRDSLDGSPIFAESSSAGPFGSNKESLFGISTKRDKGKETPPNIASLGLVNPYARGEVFSDDELFPDENPIPDESEHDEEHHSGNKDDAEDEIHEAAPGDLGLAEAITALTFDIEKLSTQEVVVDSLTRKAELTNNTSELRILRKSKASLQREIRRKELQRQQYIVQESDNSLFGRSRIEITSFIVGKENGKEYALYVIEVHRDGGEHMPAAKWAVARRYSEFFNLHQQLRANFAQVRELDFPRRRVVLHLQKDFLEKRRMALEKYLRSLLVIPDVCRSRDFRAFLSQRSIAPQLHLDPANASDKNQDFITRLYNSISDGMEDVLGNLPLPLPMLDQMSTTSTSMATTALQQHQAALSGVARGGGPLSDAAEAEAELAAFEDAKNGGGGAGGIEQMPFVKPICDLFLETFELNRGSSWLRGRAVVVVLHQLLGGTIEKKVRDQLKSLTHEESILKYISLLKGILSPPPPQPPTPTPAPPKPPRTAKEKLKSKEEAEEILATLVPDMAASVVGRANAAAAGRRLFVAFNNQRLNTSMIFTILDEIMTSVFSELKDAK
ncbi:PXA domain-containing protein [Peziza echinospora]|nr:PXA domain-containing protein [Peziza echinospora]